MTIHIFKLFLNFENIDISIYITIYASPRSSLGVYHTKKKHFQSLKKYPCTFFVIKSYIAFAHKYLSQLKEKYIVLVPYISISNSRALNSNTVFKHSLAG